MTNTVVPFRQADPDQKHIEELSRAISLWYVRRDSKFYDVCRLDKKLSKDDVQRACLYRFAEAFPHVELNAEILRVVYRTAIDAKHTISSLW